MGILLEDKDFLVGQVLDTVVIFLLGSILVGFFHTMVNYPKTFLIAFATFMGTVITLMMLFINQICNHDREKHEFKLNILNFTGIYTICLNLMIMFVVTNKLRD